MPTTTNLSNLKINVLTQSQYDGATVNEDELYLIKDADLITTITPTYDTTYANSHSITVQKNTLVQKIFIWGYVKIHSSTAIAANTDITIATLPTGYRPTRWFPVMVSSYGCNWCGYVGNSGVLSVRRGTEITANADYSLYFECFCNY